MPAEANETEEGDHTESDRDLVVYGRGVRTALRTNATAYGFSITITAAYGLASGSHGQASALQTVTFALGAALGFVLVGTVFVSLFRRASLKESGQVLTIGGVVDLLSVTAAVAGAFGLSRIPGFFAWPLTGLGVVVVYLLVGGLDVVLARWLADRTAFGSSQ